MFATADLATATVEPAPDGSAARPLLSAPGGSLTHFEFPAAHTSPAVRHRTVDELWFVTGGRGRLWRRDDDGEDVVDLGPGRAVSLPVGTTFQVQTGIDEVLTVVGVTMPPWPEEGDADVVAGRWEPTPDRSPPAR